MPLVRRTRATLRSAEFGFFGVCVNTRTHTPRFCGLTWSAGLFVLVTIFSRPWRTSWLIVGISGLDPSNIQRQQQTRRDEHARTARCRRKPHASRARAATRRTLPQLRWRRGVEGQRLHFRPPQRVPLVPWGGTRPLFGGTEK